MRYTLLLFFIMIGLGGCKRIQVQQGFEGRIEKLPWAIGRTTLASDLYAYGSYSYVPLTIHPLNRNNFFIHRMGEGDTLHLEVATNGCFHFAKHRLKIIKRYGDYRLETAQQVKPLSIQELESIVLFEQQLRSRHDNYDCTLVDSYVWRLKSDSLRLVDGSCAWNGHARLMESLGIIDNDIAINGN
jgi:hypothetical protein